jgi:hypothetical protein
MDQLPTLPVDYLEHKSENQQAKGGENMSIYNYGPNKCTCDCEFGICHCGGKTAEKEYEEKEREREREEEIRNSNTCYSKRWE